jgi:hypothetical protein
MENIVAKKTDDTRRRWEVAVKDRNFDCIRNLAVAETLPEHFYLALADGKVSTNVYLRRVHNHALGMEWLLKSVIRACNGPGWCSRPSGRSRRKNTRPGHPALLQDTAGAMGQKAAGPQRPDQFGRGRHGPQVGRGGLVSDDGPMDAAGGN